MGADLRRYAEAGSAIYHASSFFGIHISRSIRIPAALTAIFGKVGVEGVGSDFATFIRTLVVLALIGVILIFTGEVQSFRSIDGKTYAFLTLSGLATGVSWLCYYRALKLGPVAQVAPIDKLSVVLVALFGVLFLGEKLEPKNWLGVAMIAAGAGLVSPKSRR